MLKFLIVEDDVSYIDVVKNILRDVSRKLFLNLSIPENGDPNDIAAKNYAEAEILFTRQKPDVVILDLNLKNKNKTGHDFFVDYVIPNQIPVIFITGENTSGLLLPHYARYKFPFLEKPLDGDAMHSEINAILQDNYKRALIRKYDLFSRISTVIGSNDEIFLSDQDQTCIELKNLLYVQSRRDKRLSKTLFHIKGYPEPYPCNEELGDFERRVKTVSIDFVRVGNRHVLNSTHIKERKKHLFTIIMSNGDPVHVSEKAFHDFIGK